MGSKRLGRRRLVLAVAALVVPTSIAASGCKSSPTPPPICSAPQGDSNAVHALVAAQASFAVSLYGPAVSAAGSGHNAIVSPFSVSSTLMMVGAGAAGTSSMELQSVLGLPAPAAKEAPAYAALACEDETDGSANGDELLVADSVWAQKGFAYLPAFLSVLHDGYQAPLQQVDFAADPGAATDAVNAWVSRETQSKIPALLQPGDLQSTTVLVLANAVYFKGAWSTAFDPSRTSPQPFTLSDGTQVSVPTMSGRVQLGQGDTGGVAVYELGYKGGAFAMDFLVPDSGPSLSSLEGRLTPDFLASVLASLQPAQEVDLFSMPKFSFHTEIDLKPLLVAMGMPDLFDPAKADFSGMDGKMDLFVDKVVHEALIDVDEQGTIAAAATAAGEQPTSLSTASIASPFVFLVRDTRNGHIVFIGRVEDPREG